MIGLSYSSYEAALWNAEQSFFLSNVNKYNVQASNYELVQGQKNTLNVQIFTQYSNALIRNEQNLSNFYYQRFSPEMKTAVDAWLQTDPLYNPNAPSSPFAMSEYNRTYGALAQQFQEKTDLELQNARQANLNESKYLFLSILYSSALFIDGVIGRTSNKKISQVLLYMTISLTIISTVMIVQLPTATTFLDHVI